MRRLETEIVEDLFEKQFRDILRNYEFPKNVKKSTCCFTKVIDDGRNQVESNSIFNHTEIDKIGRPRNGSPIC